MIGYFLLSEPTAPSSNPSYRGTYRPGPTYVKELPEISPVNLLWMEETDLMISDPFTKLDEVERIQYIYAEAGFGLDLVMVMDKDETPSERIPPEFMGYDISHVSGYSLLSWDLNFSHPAPAFFHQRENPVYQPLLLLIERQFRPLLNTYRLFQTLEDAEFFLDVSSAMTTGFGSVWESVGYGPFSLVKMYMVRSRESILNRIVKPGEAV